jgi:hypothetical protein
MCRNSPHSFGPEPLNFLLRSCRISGRRVTMPQQWEEKRK